MRRLALADGSSLPGWDGVSLRKWLPTFRSVCCCYVYESSGRYWTPEYDASPTILRNVIKLSPVITVVWPGFEITNVWVTGCSSTCLQTFCDTFLICLYSCLPSTFRHAVDSYYLCEQLSFADFIVLPVSCRTFSSIKCAIYSTFVIVKWRTLTVTSQE